MTKPTATGDPKHDQALAYLAECGRDGATISRIASTIGEPDLNLLHNWLQDDQKKGLITKEPNTGAGLGEWMFRYGIAAQAIGVVLGWDLYERLKARAGRHGVSVPAEAAALIAEAMETHHD